MQRLLVSVLVLALGSTALADRRVGEFRLKKDPASAMKGWIVDVDHEGFQFERFGGGKMRILWVDLHDEDASKLRQAFGLELSEDEKKGLIPGHELRFKGGAIRRGLLIGVDDDGTHRLRESGLIFNYPADRVASVRDIKIKEEEAYAPEEIYARHLQRRPPETADDHVRLGDYLYDLGNWGDAAREYEAAISKDPGRQAGLADRVAELGAFREDREAAEVFQRAHKLAVLDGKWTEALQVIREHVASRPGAERRGARLLDELEAKWRVKRQAAFHQMKHRLLDNAVRRYVTGRTPSLTEARSWVSAELQRQILDELRTRMELTDDEVDEFTVGKSKGAPHWATYEGGTFVISERAKRGESSRRKIRGNPDDWWDRYDSDTRSDWLRAYAAERLDLFEVVRINMTDCPRCGGVGQVRKSSAQSLADGRHEWRELCPRCFGARQDRAVAYR